MKKQSKLMTFLMSLLLAFMLAVPGNAVSTQAAGQGDMAVHFIDVGQGLAILVQSGGENLLYDGGNRAHADEVVQYLKNQQVETIDYMISSHYDEDHLGGLVKCLDNFEVEHVLGSDYVHTSDLFNTFMNTATAHAIIVEYPSVGDTYEFGTGSFTVMAPDGISQNSNDNSVVIRLVNGNDSFMFMGDAEETRNESGLRCVKSWTSWFCIFDFLGSSGGIYTVLGSDQLRTGQFLWTSGCIDHGKTERYEYSGLSYR